ncbi:hypothetical protein N431DRAFT_425674 [Stipitochalara longipes BDJ]|nr:hypothetical protein N431DRAFT_425674 [Stipitochalara longipes BDJ]
MHFGDGTASATTVHEGNRTIDVGHDLNVDNLQRTGLAARDESLSSLEPALHSARPMTRELENEFMESVFDFEQFPSGLGTPYPVVPGATSVASLLDNPNSPSGSPASFFLASPSVASPRVDFGASSPQMATPSGSSGPSSLAALSIASPPVPVSPRYPCNFCTRTFSRARDVPRHVLLVHDPNAPWLYCPECPYRNKRRDTLEAHVRAHDERLAN